MQSKSTGGSKCPNCVNGWVIYMKPAYKAVNEYGDTVYDSDDQTMLEYASPCPLCNGGRVVEEAIQRRANIPSAFYDVDMDGFNWDIYDTDMTTQKKLAKSFVLDYKKWKAHNMGLYIWSRTKGSGKTYLASAICNSMIQLYRKHPKFVNVSNLIDLAKQEGAIDELIRSDLLVIDDIGQKGSGIAWVDDILYKIIDTRMNEKRLVIVTSNQSIAELQLDNRVTDRLNRITQELRLPDFSVRDIEANKIKRKMLEDLGLIEPDDPQQKLAV